MSRMSGALFWDIDGTLLTTGRAGILAWEEAVREVTGQTVDLSMFKTAGLPDFAIAGRLLELYGGGVDAARQVELVRRYEASLPAALPTRRGRVLEGVREILELIATQRRDLQNYLLTGNTRAGARAKLSHYGLFDFFRDGAFSEDAGDRVSIARRALGLLGGELAPERIFVIGDTPHDVACGVAISARTVAVASGDYSHEQLRACRPWLVLERLPGPEAFLDRLGLVARVDSFPGRS